MSAHVRYTHPQAVAASLKVNRDSLQVSTPAPKGAAADRYIDFLSLSKYKREGASASAESKGDAIVDSDAAGDHESVSLPCGAEDSKRTRPSSHGALEWHRYSNKEKYGAVLDPKHCEQGRSFSESSMTVSSVTVITERHIVSNLSILPMHLQSLFIPLSCLCFTSVFVLRTCCVLRSHFVFLQSAKESFPTSQYIACLVCALGKKLPQPR